MKLLLFAMLMVLSSCSTLNESQCRAHDWEAYGRIDGEKGKPPSYWIEHDTACAKYGVEVDRAIYERARTEGVKSYCTPDSGYRAGRGGERYFDVCEGAGAAAFKSQYAIGYRYFKAAAEKRDVETQLQAIPPPENIIVDALGLSPESQRRRELTSRRTQLDEELVRTDALAPSPNWQQATVSPGALSDGFGALSGTFLGFGTGHAIQGRYADKGWIFTLSEVAALAAIAAIPTSCGGRETCRGFAIGVPLLALLGVKVWETIDVWNFFNGRMQGYPHFASQR